MAGAHSRPAAEKRNKKILHISIDYGTTKVVVSYWFGIPGTQPLDTAIFEVKFSGDGTLPQKLVFKDGHCYQGYDVEQMLRKGEVIQDDVIEYLKVLFYKSLETSDFATRAHAKLKEHAKTFGLDENTTLDKLKIAALAMQLRGLMSMANDSIENDGEQQFNMTKEEIEGCRRRVFISVPGMWTPAGNRCMTAAAKKAGLMQVDLVREPQAAAAYWLHKTKVSGEGIYRPGDRILVLDAGGGTSDTISYEVQAGDNDGEIKLDSMGDASGALCGSEFINQEFLRWLVRRVKLAHLTAHYRGGLPAMSRDLGVTEAQVLEHAKEDFHDLASPHAEEIRSIYTNGLVRLVTELNLSEAEFRSQANTKFSRIKVGLARHHFEEDLAEERQSFMIHGGSGATMARYPVEFGRDEISAFFEPILEQNFKLVDASITAANPYIKTVIVIGGFRYSEYFMWRLAERFPRLTIVGASNSAVGQAHPVARGALWAFGITERQDLPATDTYGISEDQVFDSEVHTDLKAGTTTIKGTLEPNTDYAPHRWKTLVAPGGQGERNSVWQKRLLMKKEKDIHLQLYWSRDLREEDSAIWQDVGEQGKEDIVPGVEEWVLLVANLPDLEELGFELRYPDPDQVKEWRQRAQEEEEITSEIKVEYYKEEEEGDSDYQEKGSTRKTKRKANAPPEKKGCAKRVPTSKNSVDPGPCRANKPTRVRGSRCVNCKAGVPGKGACTICRTGARYELHYRIIILATGANVSVRWEMLSNPKKTVEDELVEKDLLVLHDDTIVEQSFNPNPLG